MSWITASRSVTVRALRRVAIPADATLRSGDWRPLRDEQNITEPGRRRVPGARRPSTSDGATADGGHCPEPGPGLPNIAQITAFWRVWAAAASCGGSPTSAKDSVSTATVEVRLPLRSVALPVR